MNYENFKKIIDKHPGYKAHSRLLQIQLTDYIFEKNYAELKSIFDLLNDEQAVLELMFVKNSEKMINFTSEFTRKMFNFVSSVSAYIDHTRTFMEKYYKNTEIEQEYQRRLNSEIKENAVCSFIKDFRNYYLHYSAPFSIFSCKGAFGVSDEDDGMSASFIISKEELDKFSGWKNLSKQFIEANPNGVNFKEVCETYYNIIKKLYVWLYSALEEMHQRDIEEYFNLRKQL